jgi:hypothetical protein
MVISVGIVAAELIQELVQQKCGGNFRCFLLEGSQLKDSVVVFRPEPRGVRAVRKNRAHHF